MHKPGLLPLAIVLGIIVGCALGIIANNDRTPRNVIASFPLDEKLPPVEQACEDHLPTFQLGNACLLVIARTGQEPDECPRSTSPIGCAVCAYTCP